jgi:hypothetical protein
MNIGLIVNPYAGRDIRRAIGPTRLVTDAEKIAIIRQMLAVWTQFNTLTIWAMPDHAGLVQRAAQGVPQVQWLPVAVRGDAYDSRRAAALAAERGVDCLVTLGGDGTNRVVASGCRDIPLLPLSTGTNNVFPLCINPTAAALAAATVALGVVRASEVSSARPRLVVHKNGIPWDIALVDVLVTAHLFIGARALWQTEYWREAVVLSPGPGVPGVAGVAALLPESSAAATHLRFGTQGMQVLAPVTPGRLIPVAVQSVRAVSLGQRVRCRAIDGTLALDGEREWELTSDDVIDILVDPQGPRVLNPDLCLQLARVQGFWVTPPRLP